MARVPICGYDKEFIDRATSLYRNYTCERSCVPNSKFCKYHDEKYFLKHKKELEGEFKNEIKRQMIEQNQITCVGWNIPSFELHQNTKIKSVYLMGAKVHGDIHLYSNRFQIIDFTGAVFHQSLKMVIVEIENFFSLKNCLFDNPVISQVKFINCKFNLADFSNASFGELGFQNCEFAYSEFNSTKFHKMLTIHSCKFAGNANFSKSEYNEGVVFTRTTCHHRMIFLYSKFKKPSSFNYVIFMEPRQVIFDTDLSNLSFAHTDITRIEFTGKTKWDKDGKFIILDERNLIDNTKNSDLSAVLATYRNLRENYEFRLMYEEAGRFFVREMDLRRKYSQGHNGKTIKKSWTWRNLTLANCYNVLSEYGQNFGRILMWCSVTFAVPLTYFSFFPDADTIDHIRSLNGMDRTSYISGDSIHLIWFALERTVRGFFQIEQAGLPEYAVRMASIPLLGMMFIVLRRRFERRFRH